MTIDKGTRHDNNNNNDNGHKTGYPTSWGPLAHPHLQSGETNTYVPHLSSFWQLSRAACPKYIRTYDKSLQIDWSVLKITEKHDETTREQLTEPIRRRLNTLTTGNQGESLLIMRNVATFPAESKENAQSSRDKKFSKIYFCCLHMLLSSWTHIPLLFSVYSVYYSV